MGDDERAHAGSRACVREAEGARYAEDEIDSGVADGDDIAVAASCGKTEKIDKKKTKKTKKIEKTGAPSPAQEAALKAAKVAAREAARQKREEARAARLEAQGHY